MNPTPTVVAGDFTGSLLREVQGQSLLGVWSRALASRWVEVFLPELAPSHVVPLNYALVALRDRDQVYHILHIGYGVRPRILDSLLVARSIRRRGILYQGI